MPNQSRAKEFWEKKILGWEASRYSPWLSLYPLSWTIRSRLKNASNAIRSRLAMNAEVVELACGSGYLASTLVGHVGAYRGFDIAANAIEVARKRVKAIGFTFEPRDVFDSALPASDLTVFLGLTDWLDDRQLEALFPRLQSPHVLFSYTSAARLNPYRFYRLLMDRPVSADIYRARTFSENEIRALLDRHGFEFDLISPPSTFNPGALVWAKRKT